MLSRLPTRCPESKTCIHCGKDFEPKYTSMQTACSLRCAASYAKKQRVEKEKAEKALDRKRRNDLKTIADLIAAAQIPFNAYIRARDRDKGCFVCMRPFSDAPGRVQHAGHVRSRGAAGHLRFNEDNVLGECEGCNDPKWGAKPHQIKEGAIRRIGEERFAALENDNTPHKWTREELLAIPSTYRQKLRDLQREKENA